MGKDRGDGAIVGICMDYSRNQIEKGGKKAPGACEWALVFNAPLYVCSDPEKGGIG